MKTATKALIASVALCMLGAIPAHAQTTTKICVPGTNSGSCITVDANNPLPVTGEISGIVTADQGDPNAGGVAAWPVIAEPSAVANAGIAQTQCSALCSNLVAKSGAGNLYTFNVAADSTLAGAAWWVMAFNATSAPGDGAVTPALCYAVPSGATNFSASFSNTPAYFSAGITIVASTNGCFTLAKSAHAFLSSGAK